MLEHLTPQPKIPLVASLCSGIRPGLKARLRLQPHSHLEPPLCVGQDPVGSQLLSPCPKGASLTPTQAKLGTTSPLWPVGSLDLTIYHSKDLHHCLWGYHRKTVLIAGKPLHSGPHTLPDSGSQDKFADGRLSLPPQHENIYILCMCFPLIFVYMPI